MPTGRSSSNKLVRDFNSPKAYIKEEQKKKHRNKTDDESDNTFDSEDNDHVVDDLSVAKQAIILRKAKAEAT